MMKKKCNRKGKVKRKEVGSAEKKWRSSGSVGGRKEEAVFMWDPQNHTSFGKNFLTRLDLALLFLVFYTKK